MDCELIRCKLVRIGVYAKVAENRLANSDSIGLEDALIEIELNIAKIRMEQAEGPAFGLKPAPVLTEAKGDEYIPQTPAELHNAELGIKPFEAPEAKPSKKAIPQSAEFQAKFNDFMVACQAMLNKHMTTKFPTLPLELLCPDEGNRYIRIWKRGEGEGKGHGSAWAFVDKKNGDILKPATWRAPAKHARGNIFHENPLKQVGPYGPNYLK
jgi:hypothetical protein